MRLALFNGSPRGKAGNTEFFVRHFANGFTSIEKNSYELFHLNRQSRMSEFVAAFESADCVIVAFPLYVHAMPSIVKSFIEALRPAAKSKPIAFIVQQGFDGSAQSDWLVPYLRKLPSRLNCSLSGIVVRGGSEGTRLIPESWNKKLFDALFTLGKEFGEGKPFDAKIVARLARPRKISIGRQLVYAIMSIFGLTNWYWNSQLKKNGAFKSRFAKPLGDY